MQVMPFHQFIFKRLHSLFGIALSLFLINHLYTNTLAAVSPGGKAYIDAVNFLHSLPLLGLIEILTLGLPFLIHIVWGVIYVIRSKYNHRPSNGAKVSLPKLGNNWAFALQRLTAVILIFGVVWHVYDLRFKRYPVKDQEYYYVQVEDSLALDRKMPIVPEVFMEGPVETAFGTQSWNHIKEQYAEAGTSWVQATSSGEAVYWNVLDLFQGKAIVWLYTIFVIVAAYHAFNGLYTASYSWGFFITDRSNRIWKIVNHVLMLAVTIMGLIAIWGIYA